MRTPISLYLIVMMLALLSLFSIYIGLDLLIDPTGKRAGLPPDLINELLFTNYILHGIILIVVFGLFPGFLIYPLLRRPHWRTARRISFFKNRYWAWSATLYVALNIIVTHEVLIFLAGYRTPLQSVVAFYGIGMLILTLSPGVQRYFRRSSVKYSNRET